ncbi:MAG: beta-propeller domain-containing protein [Nanoarchaeota archaeon]|nr:beta-propeller domain-containing protein [Nanoarchaeota archaeon]
MEGKNLFFIIIVFFLGLIVGGLGIYIISSNSSVLKDDLANINPDNQDNLNINPVKDSLSKDGIKQFSNIEELKDFLKKAVKSSSSQSQSRDINFMAESMDVGAVSKASADAGGGGSPASRYSKTNVQVEGVDEPDIMKNNGKYIHTLSGNKIKIIEAYPANEMKLLGEISYTNEIKDYNKPYTANYVRNIFINEDKLIVFINSHDYTPYTSISCLGLYYCGGNYDSYSLIHVYDTSDKKNPKLEQNIKLDSEYYDARMINDYVYLISRKYVNPDEPELPVYYINGVEKFVPLDHIYYFDYDDESYYLTSVSSLNVKDGKFNTKAYLIGYSSTIFASLDNIYVTSTEYMKNEDYQRILVKDAVIMLLPEEQKQKINEILDSKKYEYVKWKKIGKIVEDYYNNLPEGEKISFNNTLFDNLYNTKIKLEKERQKTVINKFSIKNENIEFVKTGKVPGRVLNQFSMDEYEGYFRIATTVGERWWWGWFNSGRQVNSTSNVYVLDKDMNTIGSLEGLASGESIYSTRFLGKRLYMVTYRQIDPLFVIDLENPVTPKVLGYLKITGVSEYLHPYDENHVIGIGNEGTTDGRLKGMKISLFDVSDVNNPKEKAKYIIGDRGTRSPVLDDHKAFLFDKETNLMVFPVTVYEINPTKYAEKEIPEWAYGEAVFQGAYIFNIDTNGITLKGKITHFSPYIPVYGAAKDASIGSVRNDGYGNSYTKIGQDQWKSDYNYHGYYLSNPRIDEFPGGISFRPNFYDQRYSIKRSLFMDNTLYTVSNTQVKANDLKSLKELKSIDLGYVDNQNYYYY